MANIKASALHMLSIHCHVLQTVTCIDGEHLNAALNKLHTRWCRLWLMFHNSHNVTLKLFLSACQISAIGYLAVTAAGHMTGDNINILRCN